MVPNLRWIKTCLHSLGPNSAAIYIWIQNDFLEVFHIWQQKCNFFKRSIYWLETKGNHWEVRPLWCETQSQLCSMSLKNQKTTNMHRRPWSTLVSMLLSEKLHSVKLTGLLLTLLSEGSGKDCLTHLGKENSMPYVVIRRRCGNKSGVRHKAISLDRNGGEWSKEEE